MGTWRFLRAQAAGRCPRERKHNTRPHNLTARMARPRSRAGPSLASWDGVRVGCTVETETNEGTFALHQPALFHRRGDEARKQGMRLEGPRLQFRVELHADKPGVVGQLDDLRQQAVRRHAAKAHAHVFQAPAVARIDLVAVAMTLGNLRVAIDPCDAAALGEHRRVGSEPHGAAEVAALAALFELVAAHPLGHQPNHRFLDRTELGRSGAGDADEVARGFDDGHLHAKADPEVGQAARAREAGGQDLALRAPFAKAAGHQDAVHVLKIWRGVLALEDLALDPIEPYLYSVGDAAVKERLVKGLIGVLESGVLADDGNRYFAFRAGDGAGDGLPLLELRGRRIGDAKGAQHLGIEAFAMIG